ncbi:MAG: hypothetical protein ABSG46_13325 [Candidatus Binataceae bacterium]
MEMRRSSILAGAAVIGLMFAAGGASAYTAKPIYVKGYGAGDSVNTSFTFDIGPDGLATTVGSDDLGGQNFAQGVSEYYDSEDTCTATDGTVGELLYLYEDIAVTTYLNGGQIYGYADYGTECVSLTTGVLNGSNPFLIFGGSGKFAQATGSGEIYFNGVLLTAPSSPGSGFFASVQYTDSG